MHHNLTGRTQPNGTAETSISKAYHRRAHFAHVTERLTTNGMINERVIQIDGEPKPFKLDTLTHKFYFGKSKTPDGVYNLHANFLVLTWSEETTFCFESQYIHMEKVNVISTRNQKTI